MRKSTPILWILVLAAVPTSLTVQGARAQSTPDDKVVVMPSEKVAVMTGSGETPLEPTRAVGTTPTVQNVSSQASSKEKPTLVLREETDAMTGRDGASLGTTGKGNPVMQGAELGHHVAVILASIVASIVAVLGLTTWRREVKGKRDMELAENALELFYRAERAIEAIRYPIWDMAVGQTRTPESNETPEEKEARDRAYVVFRRIKDHADIFDQLYALRFRFMARFGLDRAKPFDEMKWQVDTISVCTKQLARFWAEQSRMGDRTHESIKNEIREYERIISYAGTKDPTEARVRDIVGEVEQICRPIIEGQDPWLSRLRKKAPATKGGTES